MLTVDTQNRDGRFSLFENANKFFLSLYPPDSWCNENNELRLLTIRLYSVPSMQIFLAQHIKETADTVVLEQPSLDGCPATSFCWLHESITQWAGSLYGMMNGQNSLPIFSTIYSVETTGKAIVIHLPT